MIPDYSSGNKIIPARLARVLNLFREDIYIVLPGLSF